MNTKSCFGSRWQGGLFANFLDSITEGMVREGRWKSLTFGWLELMRGRRL